jgi:hypothetical protein
MVWILELTQHQARNTVKMAADAIRTYGPIAQQLLMQRNPNTAKYDVTGTPNETYALSLPTICGCTGLL